jgi:hypothetical protein
MMGDNLALLPPEQIQCLSLNLNKIDQTLEIFVRNHIWICFLFYLILPILFLFLLILRLIKADVVISGKENRRLINLLQTNALSPLLNNGLQVLHQLS